MLPFSALIATVDHLLDVTAVAKHLAHVVWGQGRCVSSISWKRPGPGWTGTGCLDQSNLAEGVPAHGRGLERGDEL